MITRSDPGGSVPRWMVERGTPGGIIKDAEKFLDWAAGDHSLAEHLADRDPDPDPDPDHDHDHEGDRSSGPGSVGAEQHDGEQEAAPKPPSAPDTRDLVSSAPEIAPTAVTAPAATTVPPSHNESDTAPEDPSDDTASCASFATACSGDPSVPAAPPRTDEEKALARLLREKAKLAEKLHRQRSRERRKRTKDDERDGKLLEKHMREVEKREARYSREIERVRKREEKRKGKQSKEVVELKGVVEALTRQNLELVERVVELEARGRLRGERETEAEVERGRERERGAAGEQ